jgi:hypothetical protein
MDVASDWADGHEQRNIAPIVLAHAAQRRLPWRDWLRLCRRDLVCTCPQDRQALQIVESALHEGVVAFRATTCRGCDKTVAEHIDRCSAFAPVRVADAAALAAVVPVVDVVAARRRAGDERRWSIVGEHVGNHVLVLSVRIHHRDAVARAERDTDALRVGELAREFSARSHAHLHPVLDHWSLVEFAASKHGKSDGEGGDAACGVAWLPRSKNVVGGGGAHSAASRNWARLISSP